MSSASKPRKSTPKGFVDSDDYMLETPKAPGYFHGKKARRCEWTISR